MKKIIIDKESRRDFIKKALYKAPTLIVLGQFVTPNEVNADFSGGPVGPPGGGKPFGKSSSTNTSKTTKRKKLKF
jgi:hypothetical protein